MNLRDDAGFERRVGELLNGRVITAARLHGLAAVRDAADVDDVEIGLPVDDADVPSAARREGERADLVRGQVRGGDAAECGFEAIEILHLRAEDLADGGDGDLALALLALEAVGRESGDPAGI